MHLRAQDIDDDNGGVFRVRRALGLSNDGRCVGRGQGIYDAYEGSETTAEAAGARQQAKESTTTTEALAEEDDHKYYNNDNGGFGRG